MFHLRMKPLALLALALCLGLGTSVHAPADEKKESSREFKDDAKVAPQARAIDFNGDLDLEFASLKTLGSRIDSARENPDPVSLALAATELAAAEKASGKKVPLTSQELWKEAIDLASRRGSSKELRAVAALTDDVEVKKTFERRAAIIVKRTGEKTKPRGIGTLTVFNNSNRIVAIYANGIFQGNVRANNEGSFEVNDMGSAGECGNDIPGNDTTIVARSGKFRWGPRVITRDIPTYKFTLNPISE